MKKINYLSGLLMAVTILSVFHGSAVAANRVPFSQEPPYVPGEVAVYATPDKLSAYQIRKVLPNAGITVVAVPEKKEKDVVAQLRSQGRRAGLNRILRASEVPSDPLYSLYQWHMTRIQSEEAWDLTYGKEVLVAVLDSGLAEDGAPDGIACVDSNRYDIVNQDNDPDDGNGHGTHVSGTIAQTTNNAIGTAGMSHGACILPVKVLDDSGSGTSADIADGIFYAANIGANVINMSLGYSFRFPIDSDQIIDPALDYAYDNNVTVVCAAGNEGRDHVGYPALYPTTIAVGATDYADKLASYSNSGLGLDVVAPGGDVYADLNSDGYPDGVLQETRIDGAWGYWFFDGTSMASPHVAAVAAMLISYGVAGTPDEVYETLTSTALDLGDAGFDPVYGHGLVQAHAALTGTVSEPPVCTDADGDGWCVEDGDCDDNNSSVYPGAPDSRRGRDRDGIDNDCDGIIDG
ncbi:MAG: S8 family serine peptidase [Gammaproteobacteria bacterium]|nr:S8 family serine peptidase [Gammaproteobacteria bacterium]